MAKNNNIKEKTQKIRDTADEIDDEVDEVGGKTRGDPTCEVNY